MSGGCMHRLYADPHFHLDTHGDADTHSHVHGNGDTDRHRFEHHH